MTSSLLPERPLIISPTLAATIGLEEAVMLHVFSEQLQQRTTLIRSQLAWLRLSNDELARLFPFWTDIDIKRIKASLQNLGLIAIDADTGDEYSYYYAINEQVEGAEEAPAGNFVTPGQSAARPSDSGQTNSDGATFIPPDWQPDESWLTQCRQRGIANEFALSLVPEFVNYWRDRGQSRFSWGNAFCKHVLKEWRREQTERNAGELSSPMTDGWRPSHDAFSILENSGISADFIDDAIPEFVLYWRERGVVNGAWNSKFIEHIRRQWAKFSASFGYDNTPHLIPDNWQPSADCFDVLQLAEIDEDFARNKIPEFVMYWKDARQVKASWNTTFLQYIKESWARQLKQLEVADIDHAENQSFVGSNQQKVKDRFRRIADRSWAE